MPDEPVVVALQVIDALEALGVPYMIGGSLASAVYGVARSTLDVDLVADLKMDLAEPLANALRDAFYVDVESIRDAIQRRSSFNLIHLETMFKVDVFVLKRRPYDQAEFDRRTEQVVAAEPERSACVASAEDTALTKLEWYRLGGEGSERQWRDVLGVLRAQEGQLDLAYLRMWAPELGVADLLERALLEAQRGA